MNIKTFFTWVLHVVASIAIVVIPILIASHPSWGTVTISGVLLWLYQLAISYTSVPTIGARFPKKVQ